MVLGLVVTLPLFWVTWYALTEGLDLGAWRALLADPQLPRAAQHSLWTGLAATVLSVLLSAWFVSRTFPGPAWDRLLRWLAPMLAVPHAAFAIGLLFLIAPSGWLLRAFSPWATGLLHPPAWATTQDSWGLGLIAVLLAKEVPFLLWTAATQLQRADIAQRWTRELEVARSMGYGAQRAWWRVLWPQLWPRMWSPLLAVFAYSVTVVDMAQIIGPAAPPTLSVLAWSWLQDADLARNTQGAAAAWLLALGAGLLVALLWPLPHLARWRGRWVDGRRGLARAQPIRWLPWGFVLLLVLYLAVMLALGVGSVSGVWPFPRFWPQRLSLDAWTAVLGSASTLQNTITLALASSLAALLWSLLWLEFAPPRWDAAMRRLIYLPLLLPSVLWVVGLHQLTLAWGLDGHWGGLWLAHSLASTPYVLIVLSPAYLGFDQSYAQLVAALSKGRAALLLRVKWPLLRASLAGAFAVGFAVSVAQYLPTLYIGAGRYSSVTTEAVTLASGGQRSLAAAYAWLQWLLPVLMFALAAWLGRPRRFAR
jgi:putative thiamine transport system permease protein